jgi:hypothetical protein
LKEKPIATRI